MNGGMVAKKIASVVMPWAQSAGLTTNEYFVSGGAIGSLLRGEEPADYDVFLINDYAAQKVAMTPGKAYSNGNVIGFMRDGAQVQAITRWIGTPEQIIKDFDFVHTQMYWSPLRPTDITMWVQDTVRFATRKEIVPIPGNVNALSITRIGKLLMRGWTISDADMIGAIIDSGISTTTAGGMLRLDLLGAFQDVADCGEYMGEIEPADTPLLERFSETKIEARLLAFSWRLNDIAMSLALAHEAMQTGIEVEF